MANPSLEGNAPAPDDGANGARSKQASTEKGDCGQGNQLAATRRRRRQLAGRVLTGLAGLFLIFDGVGKLMMPAQVVEASGRLGFPLSLTPGVGFLLLVLTLVYLLPRTAVLGAVLLTGYLGGAVAVQLRAGSTVFETVFPVLTAILVWAGIYLREERLRSVFPMRCLGRSS